jgi:transposase InsO family protein
LALVVLSVVEQRLDAVRAVLAGAEVTEVAARLGVHRATVHRWVARYLVGQVGGLADRSHRPRSCPHQASEQVELAVVEMRREHPRWGSRRIRLELLHKPGRWLPDGVVVPSERTIDRILKRYGLLRERPRKKPRSAYVRFERPEPMQLWGIDIVDGLRLVDTATGELRGVKVVTGIDDHSRFCVMAKGVERATSRAVCLAFAEALVRFGAPQEVITDNGKQFTDRFGRHGLRNGEVLFDQVCRKNGITHRLTAPASPNQNGKVERFHGTLGPDFMTNAEPFTSLDAAQAAVDAWVEHYNTDRPNQALDPKAPVTPDERFTPASDAERELLELWLPPTTLVETTPPATAPAKTTPTPAPATWAGRAIEFDRVVPPSGNMAVAGKQFWLGPARAGTVVRFWADYDVIHLSIGSARVKSVRSHLTDADLRRLIAQGAVNAGPPPIPAPESAEAFEVDRTVANAGTVSLGNKVILAAWILAGRRVSIRIEPELLLFFDPDTRELLRTRPNPLGPDAIRRIRGLRKAGPPPRPSLEPVRVQRRTDGSGTLTVVGQQIALGREHRLQTLAILVSETTLTVEMPDGGTKVVRRTTTQPPRVIKSRRPRTASTS